MNLDKIITYTNQDKEYQEFNIRAIDYQKKMQNLMFEIYKRLIDEQNIMGINTD